MTSQSNEEIFFSRMKEQILFSSKTKYYAAIAVGLLVLLGFLLYGTIRTDLTCTRSSEGLVDCMMVQSSRLLKMSPVQVHQPIAVDVVEHRGSKGRRSYSAEIRAANVGYTVSILTSFRAETAQDVADEINAFLHESQASSFTATFPKYRPRIEPDRSNLQIR